MRSLSGIRRSYATGGGGVTVQYEGQKPPVPELASTIWSESAIGGGSAIRGSTVYYHIYMYEYNFTPKVHVCNGTNV